jgi:pimeloyl-ACP methyl ester carboxylesterase
VLLTPIGLDSGCWQWLELPAGIEVARPEHPGHGGRPRGQAQFDLDRLADEVASAHRGPLHLAGVSLGGMVAQHLALRHPGRVSSLLLASTGPSADPETGRARAAETEEKGMEGVLETTLRRWFTPEALAREPEHPGVAYVRRTLLALDSSSFADGWRAIATHDVLDRLDEIDAPTTCLAGSADPAAPPERMRRLAEAIPGARMIVLEGGPHMLHLERPGEFSAALRLHLEEAGAL